MGTPSIRTEGEYFQVRTALVRIPRYRLHTVCMWKVEANRPRQQEFALALRILTDPGKLQTQRRMKQLETHGLLHGLEFPRHERTLFPLFAHTTATSMSLYGSCLGPSLNYRMRVPGTQRCDQSRLCISYVWISQRAPGPSPSPDLQSRGTVLCMPRSI